jgi:hypothetical protein
MNGCSIMNNSADYGPGGAYGGALTNCTVSNNSSGYSGGGVTGGTLYNCVVSGNNSGYGGGVYYGTVAYNCTISGNYASYGGGAESCTLVNCLVTGNTAGGYGGGAYYGTLINCTVTGNTAQLFGGYGGGAYNATLDNCIVYYNNGGASGPNDYSCTLNYCCTPTATGAGNVTNPPAFDASDHLLSGSPCIDAGTNSYVTTPLDLAGNLRIANGKVDMGAYEFQTTSPLTVSLQASLTNVPVAYPVNFTGIFSKGQGDSWNFGDGTVASNQLSITHTWAVAGDYPVVLTAYDVSSPGGVSATIMIHVKNQIVYYVNAAGSNPVPPYDSWAAAATSIQDAVDAALPVARSLVLVTNGIYLRGGRVAYGSLTNRVMIGKPITVQSVNGPAMTVIQGNPAIGDSAVRCAYVTNNAILAGFTLVSGATRSAGDTTREDSGGGVWCEFTTAVVSNCIISGNIAVSGGGGAHGGSLNNCIVSSNATSFGPNPGNGGGANASDVTNCIFAANQASGAGGGVYNCSVNSSAFVENSSGASGGGADSSTLNNCTLTENLSPYGGGANGSTLNNCIVYYNTAVNGSNYWGSTLNYCCALPLALNGGGNITAAPVLTDSSHLSAVSPCIGAGISNYIAGTDLDGQPWLNPPSIGCDEYYGGAITGPLTVGVQLNFTNFATGFAIAGNGTILGHASVSVWNFGDGTIITNHLAINHAWPAAGTYPVVLTAYNSSYPGGVSATTVVQVVDHPIHYVSLNSASPAVPYFSWVTAATNIQDAIDAAYAGGTVLVSNGIYQAGGKVIHGALTNRVAVTRPLLVRSVNGPAQTTIQGGQVPGTTNGDAAARCVYLTNNTMLSGFTITLGATRAAGDSTLEQSGGGIYCEAGSAVISNCVLAANAAAYSAGGVYQGTLNNCLITGSLALDNGGGAVGATLTGCVISNNAAAANWGGGLENCTATNCLIAANSAYYAGGMDNGFAYKCQLINNRASYGGGTQGGTLIGCLVLSNTAAQWSGGSYGGTLYDCLILTNYAGSDGGGAGGCYLNNCTVVGNVSGNVGGGISETYYAFNCICYYNTAASSGSNAYGSVLNNCCVIPDPGGMGNFTNAPLFVNAAAGDFHLQSNSPCINSGLNADAPDSFDFDGKPRIVGGTVDVGAYEYQSPSSILSYVWAQQYGLPTDGSADYADSDHTGMNNWQKWIAGLNPTNPASVLMMLPAVTNNALGVTVSWRSVNTRTYYMQRATNLAAQPAFSAIQSNLVGQAGTTSFTDTTATNGGPYFYRVGVQ